MCRLLQEYHFGL